MSLRKLKHHEQKLLKKVNFLQQNNSELHAADIVRRFHLSGREEYHKYEKIVNSIQALVNRLKSLESTDPYRQRMTDLLVNKLHTMGLIQNKSLVDASNMTVTKFCTRRLPVLLVRLKMAENLTQAIRFVQHGHVRVGPNTITDQAFLVTRPLEDFVTWVDSSKIKRTVLKYNDQLDDYDNPAL